MRAAGQWEEPWWETLLEGTTVTLAEFALEWCNCHSRLRTCAKILNHSFK